MMLQEMVARRSVTAEGAEVLRGIAAGRHSYLVYAPPRNAGKSTLVQAILAEAPEGVARRAFLGTEAEVEELAAEPRPGYLVVAEIGHRGVRGYLAGEEVVRAFRLLERGWALASCLHAGSPEEVFAVLARNGVAPAAAAAVRYLAEVRPLGDPREPATRRVVQRVDEVAGVDGERPVCRPLYRWEEEG
jgi:hypothetical protein